MEMNWNFRIGDHGAANASHRPCPAIVLGAAGGGDLDNSALITIIEMLAGVEARTRA